MNVSKTPISNVEGYINYFRFLAQMHTDLRHEEESEGGDGVPGTKHFTRIGVEEVLSALQIGMGWPCLTLELYEIDAAGQTVADIKLLPKGAFMILDNPYSGSDRDQEACFQNAERIAFDILKRIWQDHHAANVDECQTPFKSFGFNRFTMQPVGPVFSGQYGYRIVFEFELQLEIDITAAPNPNNFTDTQNEDA